MTAVALMGVVMAAGLATYSQVDTQGSQARQERVRESTFNLAEAALNTQAFKLSRRWPASSGRAFVPAATGTTPTCSSSSAPADFCPQPTDLAQGYDSADYAAGRAWKTWVRDHSAPPPARSSTGLRCACGRLGTRTATASSSFELLQRCAARRALAAQVQIERVVETLNFPERTVIRVHSGPTTTATRRSSRPSPPRQARIRDRPLHELTNDDNCRIGARPPQVSRRGRLTASSRSPRFQWTRGPAPEAAVANGTYYTSCPCRAADRKRRLRRATVAGATPQRDLQPVREPRSGR